MSDGERKLATIRRIEEVAEIEGADAICAYRVGGWWVVGKKGEFSVDDFAVYFELDSWIPTEIAEFLSKGKEPKVYNGIRGERLRTVRLRKQLSQGLLLPLDILGDVDGSSYYKASIPPNRWEVYGLSVNHEDGADCTEYLGIQKWEAPINAQLAGMARGNFPSFIKKTDEERIQNIGAEIRNAFERGDVFEMSMKLDGSSCTAYYNNGTLGVCSRNIDLKLDQEGNAFVDICTSTGLLEALLIYGRNLAVQGELMGGGIQGNREKFDKHEFFVFKVWDIDAQVYLSPDERMIALYNLESHGFKMKHVPIINPEFKLPSDKISDLLSLADGPSINNKIREGIVLKRHDGLFSFKIISNQFLLKEGD